MHNLWLSSQQEIVIFHQKQHSGILLNRNGYYIFLQNDFPSQEKYLPYLRLNKLQPIHTDSDFITGSLYWQNSYLSTSSVTVYLATPLKTAYRQADILIITGNLSPTNIFSTDSLDFYPSLIITDGSNNRLTVINWQKFCSQHHLPLWDTSALGSIRIPIK